MIGYAALRSVGVDVDVRHTDQQLDLFRLIVGPQLQVVDQTRAEHLASYADSSHMAFRPPAGRSVPAFTMMVGRNRFASCCAVPRWIGAAAVEPL